MIATCYLPPLYKTNFYMALRWRNDDSSECRIVLEASCRLSLTSFAGYFVMFCFALIPDQVVQPSQSIPSLM